MDGSKEKLIQDITKEVIAALSIKKEKSNKRPQNGPYMLVIGNPDNIPTYLREGSTMCTLDDYTNNSDISKYNKICITKLSFTEMSDIALCRDSHPAQCAIINALFRSKEVLLLESGLPHRTLSPTVNRTIYSVLEEYLSIILKFGVKLVNDQASQEVNKGVIDPVYTDCKQSSGMPNAEHLITESIAIELVKSGDIVRLSPNTIITPLAKDVLNHANVEVISER